MRYRKLRIAWSVGWGLAAMLLIVLWVRSFWVSDSISAKIWQYRWDVCSSFGTIGSLAWADDEPKENWFFKRFESEQSPLLWWRDMLGAANFAVDYVVVDNEVKYLVVRCWVLPVLAAFAGVLPWLRYRFTLRALLIAIALISVGLGLTVWRINQVPLVDRPIDDPDT